MKVQLYFRHSEPIEFNNVTQFLHSGETWLIRAQDGNLVKSATIRAADLVMHIVLQTEEELANQRIEVTDVQVEEFKQGLQDGWSPAVQEQDRISKERERTVAELNQR